MLKRQKQYLLQWKKTRWKKVNINIIFTLSLYLIYIIHSDGPAYNYHNTGLKGHYLSTPHYKITSIRMTTPKVIGRISASIDCAAATTPEKTIFLDKKVPHKNLIIPVNIETHHKNKNDVSQKYEKSEVNHHHIYNHTDETENNNRFTLLTPKEYNITHTKINKEQNIPGLHETSLHKTNKNNTRNSFIHTTVHFFFSQNHPT